MIKNNLPDKSGNPQSLKKLSQQFECANVHIVGEDFLQVVCHIRHKKKNLLVSAQMFLSVRKHPMGSHIYDVQKNDQ